MRETVLGTVQRRLRDGLRDLRAHEPARAMKALREAVRLCPAHEEVLLDTCLYWLSVALLRNNDRQMAVTSLANGVRLRKRGKCARLYARVRNGYGMAKASCSDHDDYRAFFSIHMRRYMALLGIRSFESQEHLDEVLERMAISWLRFKSEYPCDGMSCIQKLQLMHAWHIDMSFGDDMQWMSPVRIVDHRETERLGRIKRVRSPYEK